MAFAPSLRGLWAVSCLLLLGLAAAPAAAQITRLPPIDDMPSPPGWSFEPGASGKANLDTLPGGSEAIGASPALPLDNVAPSAASPNWNSFIPGDGSLPVFDSGEVDPLLAGYYDPFRTQFAFGNQGVQPYKFGWYSYDDFTYLPTAPVHGVGGSFQDLEWNSSVRYTRRVGDQMLLAWTPSWNAQFWTGPSGVPLPGSVDQLSSDVQLSSLRAGPWNWQIGFTPQINSDFHRTLDWYAYMFDGRAVLFYQSSPKWRWAFGAAYWNRVVDRFIPYGGVIWTPDDKWEFRLFFPKTRISRYLGAAHGNHYWAYFTAEYNVQAYQVDLQDPLHVKTRAQMSDDRLALGISVQRNAATGFAEVGVVLDRHFTFRNDTPDFSINNALMLRTGFLY